MTGLGNWLDVRRYGIQDGTHTQPAYSFSREVKNIKCRDRVRQNYDQFA